MNLLNLGCGPHIFENWVNADDYAFKRRLRQREFKANWHLDIARTWNCPDNYWDGIFTEHVIEHLQYSDAVFTLQECLRTMKPGAWLRISLPDLEIYSQAYKHGNYNPVFGDFPERALLISALTQQHMHLSTWDKPLLLRVLNEIGFIDSRSVSFGVGSNQLLIRDDSDKAHESL